MPAKPHYNVVCAVVCHNGEVLCAQKSSTKYSYTSFRWEFPGGKVEPLESPQQALRREMMEEMALPIETSNLIGIFDHSYPDFNITLRAYFCRTAERHIVACEHNQIQWLPPSELTTLDWCAADLPIAKKVASLLSSTRPEKR